MNEPQDMTAPQAVAGEGRGDTENTLESADHTLSAGQREEVDQAPRKYRRLLLKALEGAASPRKAIQANCLTCTHFSIAEIRHCTVLRCPLHAYRPYQQVAS